MTFEPSATTHKAIGLAALLGYVSTIAFANWAISMWGFVPVGFGLLAPAGVYFAGVAFTARDAVRETLGLRAAWVAILAGAALSALASPRLALASGVAFGLSETADALVYEPLRRRGWMWAVLGSNVVGFTADSVMFLVLAFGSLDFLAGQIIGKAWATLATLVVVLAVKRGRRALLSRYALA